ncbi:fatty acid--CoA ligase FadD10 [Mycolicibacterium sp. CBM1]
MRSHPQTVLDRILGQAQRRPDAVALRRCDGTGTLTYRDLAAETRRLAAELAAQSVTRASRVFVLSDNGPETYLSVLACAELGAIAVLVDGRLPLATMRRFAQIADPAVILATPGSPLSIAELAGSLGSLAVLRVAPGAGEADAARLRGLDIRGGVADLGADDPLAMIFTSGTTGEPKAVLLANRTFFAVQDILHADRLDWVDWVVGETTYSPLPATHIGGLWWIMTCLMQGCVCITGGENTASLLSILMDNDVATTCVVPTLLSRLVADARATGATMPALRLVGYGGSRAIAADVGFIEAAGVKTAQVYGLSETGCTALCLPTEDGSITRIEAGAVGRPYPGVEVHLDADGSGPPLGSDAASPASSGTLWIKSPANMLGYWNNADHTRQVLVAGWVNTGDILERHDDGFFYIRGRSSELIISGGVNIAPDDVDRIAESVEGVQEAACFEIPDAEFGALVGLAVIPSTALDESATGTLKQRIAAAFRREAESVARPSTIVIVTEVPRTQSGKVMRASLAAKLGASARG